MLSVAVHLHKGTKDETRGPNAVLFQIVEEDVRNVHRGMARAVVEQRVEDVAPLAMDRNSKWG